jgi:hypothetical protein
MKITTYRLDACETCGHCPPHSIEEHLSAIQHAISAAERVGIVVSVRRTRQGVAYDYRVSGTQIAQPFGGPDGLKATPSDNQPTIEEN